MSEERWAQVSGFPDYAISSHGRVKNLRFDKILTPRPNSYEQQRVVLYRDGRRFDVYVHHLVLDAFVPEYTPGTRVFHDDRNNSNNHVPNLTFHGRPQEPRVVDTSLPPGRRIRIVGTNLVFRTVDECARYIGGQPSSIYRVLRGERGTHRGYTFEVVHTNEH